MSTANLCVKLVAAPLQVEAWLDTGTLLRRTDALLRATRNADDHSGAEHALRLHSSLHRSPAPDLGVARAGTARWDDPYCTAARVRRHRRRVDRRAPARLGNGARPTARGVGAEAAEQLRCTRSAESAAAVRLARARRSWTAGRELRSRTRRPDVASDARRRRDRVRGCVVPHVARRRPPRAALTGWTSSSAISAVPSHRSRQLCPARGPRPSLVSRRRGLVGRRHGRTGRRRACRLVARPNRGSQWNRAWPADPGDPRCPLPREHRRGWSRVSAHRGGRASLPGAPRYERSGGV